MTFDHIRDVAARYDGADGEAAALEVAARRRLEWRASHGGKQCSACRRTLPVSSFHRDQTRPDGLRKSCRDCVALYDKARRGPS